MAPDARKRGKTDTGQDIKEIQRQMVNAANELDQLNAMMAAWPDKQQQLRGASDMLADWEIGIAGGEGRATGSDRRDCKRCVHMEAFKAVNGDTVFNICTVEPYEEDEQFGIVTWQEVSTFVSDDCMSFEER